MKEQGEVPCEPPLHLYPVGITWNVDGNVRTESYCAVCLEPLDEGVKDDQ